MIKDIKAFKTEDIVKYAPLADAVTSESGSRSTAGAKSMIEANAGLYDYINDNLMSGEEAEETASAADDDLITAIAALSPEEIEEMAASMDEEDLRSVVSYVIDYFTDEDGKVDEAKVFEMVGAFMNDKWSDAEIAEAVEELEPDEDESITDQETVDGWQAVIDSFMKELNEENMTAWLQKAFSGSAEGAEQTDAQSVGGGLSSLLQGLFSAFVKETNE